MDDRFEVLFVCVGNMCRSPLAAGLLRARLHQRLGPAAAAFAVNSAGIAARDGAPMDPLAAAELRRLGGDPDGFTATRLEAVRAESAGLVLTMTQALRSMVLQEAPVTFRRTFTLAEFAALARRTHPSHDPEPAPALDELASWAWGRRALVAHDDCDVPDPIGGSVRVHREVADLLDGHVGAVAAVLTACARDATATSQSQRP